MLRPNFSVETGNGMANLTPPLCLSKYLPNLKGKKNLPEAQFCKVFIRFDKSGEMVLESRVWVLSPNFSVETGNGMAI